SQLSKPPYRLGATRARDVRASVARGVITLKMASLLSARLFACLVSGCYGRFLHVITILFPGSARRCAGDSAERPCRAQPGRSAALPWPPRNHLASRCPQPMGAPDTVRSTADLADRALCDRDRDPSRRADRPRLIYRSRYGRGGW